eukprot:411791-Pleurochrysis_carterae.AAC.1
MKSFGSRGVLGKHQISVAEKEQNSVYVNVLDGLRPFGTLNPAGPSSFGKFNPTGMYEQVTAKSRRRQMPSLSE